MRTWWQAALAAVLTVTLPGQMRGVPMRRPPSSAARSALDATPPRQRAGEARIMLWPCGPPRLKRCSATSPTQSWSISGSRPPSPARRQLHGPHRRPRRCFTRLPSRLHVRRQSTAAIFDRVSGWALSVARHRLGQPAKRPGWPALVSSIAGPAAQAQRSIALDRARPDLKLPARRLPLHRSKEELRLTGNTYATSWIDLDVAIY